MFAVRERFWRWQNNNCQHKFSNHKPKSMNITVIRVFVCMQCSIKSSKYWKLINIYGPRKSFGRNAFFALWMLACRPSISLILHFHLFRPLTCPYLRTNTQLLGQISILAWRWVFLSLVRVPFKPLLWNEKWHEEILLK